MTINNTSAETWFVYLLRCADQSLYTGITNDIARRVQQHGAGKASRYTRSRLPIALVYQETQPSRSVALKRELAIKALPKADKELLVATKKRKASGDRGNDLQTPRLKS